MGIKQKKIWMIQQQAEAKTFQIFNCQANVNFVQYLICRTNNIRELKTAEHCGNTAQQKFLECKYFIKINHKSKRQNKIKFLFTNYFSINGGSFQRNKVRNVIIW